MCGCRVDRAKRTKTKTTFSNVKFLPGLPAFHLCAVREEFRKRADRPTVAGKRSAGIPRGRRAGVNSLAISTSVGKLEILVQLFVHYTKPPTDGLALGTLFSAEATSSV